MSDVQEPTKCQHDGCNCDATDTSEYCSDQCKTAAGGGPEVGCQCGHPGCEGAN